MPWNKKISHLCTSLGSTFNSLHKLIRRNWPSRISSNFEELLLLWNFRQGGFSTQGPVRKLPTESNGICVQILRYSWVVIGQNSLTNFDWCPSGKEQTLSHFRRISGISPLPVSLKRKGIRCFAFYFKKMRLTLYSTPPIPLPKPSPPPHIFLQKFFMFLENQITLS